jgi:hypothetical protein
MLRPEKTLEGFVDIYQGHYDTDALMERGDGSDEHVG